ncbi:hypothetical protein BGW41_003622 [Actinomortierella wolfii]|nr:hypothetical protein BGW41_003622 [Actinomortierella wolfii]
MSTVPGAPRPRPPTNTTPLPEFTANPIFPPPFTTTPTRKPRPSTTTISAPLTTVTDIDTPVIDDNKQSGGGGGMSGGAIAGIVVGFLALLALSVLGGFMLLKKRRRRMRASGKEPPADPYGRSTGYQRQHFEAASSGDDSQQQQDERRGGPLAFLAALVNGVSGGKRPASPARGSGGGAQNKSMSEQKPRELAQVVLGSDGKISSNSPLPPLPHQQQPLQHQAPPLQPPPVVHQTGPVSALPSSTVFYSGTTGSPSTVVGSLPVALHQAPLPAIPLQQQQQQQPGGVVVAAHQPQPHIQPQMALQQQSCVPYATGSQPAVTSFQQQPVYYQPGTGLVSVATPVAPPPSQPGIVGATGGLTQPMYQPQQPAQMHPAVANQQYMQIVPQQGYAPPLSQDSTILQQHSQQPPLNQQQQQQQQQQLQQQQQQQQQLQPFDLHASVLPSLHIVQQPAPPVSVVLATSTAAAGSMASSPTSPSSMTSTMRHQQQQRPKAKKEEKPPIYLPADSSRPLLSQGLFKIVPDDDDEAELAAVAAAQARASGEGETIQGGNHNNGNDGQKDGDELVSVPIPGALELVSSVRGRVEQHQMQQQSMNDGAKPREPVIVGSDIVLQPLPSELKRMNSQRAQSPSLTSTGTTITSTTTATSSANTQEAGAGAGAVTVPPAISLTVGGDRTSSSAHTPSLASAVLAAANAAAASFSSPSSNGGYHDSRTSPSYSTATSPLFSQPSRTNTLGEALPTMGTEEYLERTDDKEEYNSSVHGEKVSDGSMLLRDRPFSPVSIGSSNNGSQSGYVASPVSVPVSPVSQFNDKQELDDTGNEMETQRQGGFQEPAVAKGANHSHAHLNNHTPTPSSMMVLSRPLNMAAIAEHRAATPPPVINHATKPKIK